MEKPILFNTEMVKAILEDRKTRTSRPIKPQPTNPRWNNIGWLGWDDGHGYQIKPQYQVDDILWVRETWCERLGDISRGQYIYKAHKDLQDEIHQYALDQNKWRPSIHMPRAAARIFLKVTDLRVERVQDITEEDALAEGVVPLLDKNGVVMISARGKFHALWDSIYAKQGYGWDINPGVWVYEFERLEGYNGRDMD